MHISLHKEHTSPAPDHYCYRAPDTTSQGATRSTASLRREGNLLRTTHLFVLYSEKSQGLLIQGGQLFPQFKDMIGPVAVVVKPGKTVGEGRV